MANQNFDFSTLSDSTRPFIIAEIGSNHMGNMKTAKELIKAAKDAGCDAVKFQSWEWDTLESQKDFSAQTEYARPGFAVTGLENIKKVLQLSAQHHQELKAYCDEVDIIFSSSVFTNDQVDLLVRVGAPFLKIASMDIVNLPLLSYAASKQLPLIISTGMANEQEIARAVEVVFATGNKQLVLLHCVGMYPTPTANVNLATIPYLRKKFQLPIGFSDHSLSVDIPVAAVALGACVIEKHFMLENQECREKKVSIDPACMKRLVEGAKMVGQAFGEPKTDVLPEEEAAQVKMRRSLVMATTCTAGHILSSQDLSYKRPGTGLPITDLAKVLGKTLAIAKEEGDVLIETDFRS